MERRTIDLSNKPSSDESLVQQLQEHRQAQDKLRKVSTVDVNKLRKDVYTVCAWARLPDQKRLITLYVSIAQSKKYPDVAVECPQLWHAVVSRFPDLSAKYPSLVKMAVTEGHLPSFKTDLNVLLQHISSVQQGVSSIQTCSNAFEGHLQRKYYKVDQ